MRVILLLFNLIFVTFIVKGDTISQSVASFLVEKIADTGGATYSKSTDSEFIEDVFSISNLKEASKYMIHSTRNFILEPMTNDNNIDFEPHLLKDAQNAQNVNFQVSNDQKNNVPSDEFYFAEVSKSNKRGFFGNFLRKNAAPLILEE